MPLTQLMQNLISNAIKFRGREQLRITIQVQDQGREWVISVCDNGEGFDPQFSSHLFKMFNRLHEAEKHPGSGIGLAIAKKIVEFHGGRIWAESQPGTGAIFHFSLPKDEGLA
jgi:signal transduction histidine kinase